MVVALVVGNKAKESHRPVGGTAQGHSAHTAAVADGQAAVELDVEPVELQWSLEGFAQPVELAFEVLV